MSNNKFEKTLKLDFGTKSTTVSLPFVGELMILFSENEVSWGVSAMVGLGNVATVMQKKKDPALDILDTAGLQLLLDNGERLYVHVWRDIDDGVYVVNVDLM